jgi:hypothetical protein
MSENLILSLFFFGLSIISAYFFLQDELKSEVNKQKEKDDTLKSIEQCLIDIQAEVEKINSKLR